MPTNYFEILTVVARIVCRTANECKNLPAHQTRSYKTINKEIGSLVENISRMEKLGSAITIETKTTMLRMQAPVVDGSEHPRILRLDEYKAAAQTLAEAFWEDDVAMYFIETGDRVLTNQQKWKLHVSILEKLVYAHCLKGLVTTIGPNYDSVALW